MRKIKSDLFNMVFVLSLIAMTSAAIVTFVYSKTKPVIEKNAKKTEISAIIELFGDDFDNDPFEGVNELNAEKDIIIYPLKKGPAVYALAIKTYSNKGFGGDIYLMTGFHISGELAGYKVLSHKETPGLGSKISESAFLDQFKNLKVLENTLKLRTNGGQIDGITSATISSKAVLDALEKARIAYKRFTMGKSE